MINRNGLITLRRMMLILTLSVSVIFPFSPMHDVVCAGSAKAMEPEHHKTITYHADRDTYTVKLNVIGKEETVVGEKPKVDVVFVLDTSGSMKYSLAGDWWWSSEPSRLDILKRSLTSENGMLKQLLDDDKKIARSRWSISTTLLQCRDRRLILRRRNTMQTIFPPTEARVFSSD